jgi:hypothetical protein
MNKPDVDFINLNINLWTPDVAAAPTTFSNSLRHTVTA